MTSSQDIAIHMLLESSSSDSSSSEESSENSSGDDEFLLAILAATIHRKRVLAETNVGPRCFSSYTDKDFIDQFRMRRETAEQLKAMLARSGFVPQHNRGRKKISVEANILIALSYLANKESQRSISERFHTTESSVFRVVRRVMEWVLTMKSDLIQWPTGDRVSEVTQGFQQKSGLPRVLGAISATHITMMKPREHQKMYVNREGAHSVVLQAVIDHNLMFTNLSCGEPGSISDLEVLQKSLLYKETSQSSEHLFPRETYLVGGLPYSPLTWLVTPFKEDDSLTDEQVTFNRAHSLALSTANVAFEILRNRFRRLHYLEFEDMQWSVKMIMVCGILHNICLQNNDLGSDIVIEQADNEPVIVDGCADCDT